MGNTINVEVNYIANSECQKQLIKQGRSGESRQSITVAMPIESLDLLPIYIDRDGLMFLQVDEHHYEKSWIDELHNLDGCTNIVCICCGKHTETVTLSKPITSYQDVLDVFAQNKNRLEIAQSKIAEIKNRKIELEQIKNELTKNITKELEAKYSKSFTKLEQIKCIIAGKTRVRTSQIQDIIYN